MVVGVEAKINKKGPQFEALFYLYLVYDQFLGFFALSALG
jgi:hypothetical protein